MLNKSIQQEATGLFLKAADQLLRPMNQKNAAHQVGVISVLQLTEVHVKGETFFAMELQQDPSI